MDASKQMLGMMAEIGAIRNVVVQTVGLRLLDEADPVGTCKLVSKLLTDTPTLPTDTAGDIDPAMSDLLAALTDERTAALGNDVQEYVESMLGAT